MFNWRLYRLALLPSALAVVVLLFSVVSRPEPLRSVAPSDPFDTGRAMSLTRELLTAAPDRGSGGEGDRAAAEFVARRFAAIEGGEVAVQQFGDELRNVELTIPGETSDTVVIAAPRGCADGPCAVSTGSATGALLELAESIATSGHSHTIRLVSLDEPAPGDSGARALSSSLSASDPPTAVIILAAPALAAPVGPLVLPWSSGPQSTAAALTESAAASVGAEFDGPEALSEGTVPSLMRLAVPAELGPQAPLIEDGYDAVAITTAGELPVRQAEDSAANLSARSLGSSGRSVLSLLDVLDGAGKPLEHGPAAYVPLAGKLIPGWAIALLALALLAPVAVVSTEALVRSARSGEPVSGSVAWALSRTGPFFGVALLALALSGLGVLPNLAFPFDPARHPFGPGPAAGLLFLTASFAGCVWLLGRAPRPRPAPESVGPVVGALLSATTLGIWLANPFLALLLVPTAHLWLLGCAPELRGSRVRVRTAALAGLLVPALIGLSLADRLGVGVEIPWQLLLMLGGGHFGVLAVIGFSALGGCLLAVLTLGRSEGVVGTGPFPAVRVRGPVTYAGPGSLGGTDSAISRR